MFKLIIILVLSIYLLNKLSGFVFKVMGRTQQPIIPPFRRSNNTPPADPQPKKSKKGGIKGGEYIDYEEVK